jgi:hypothetical protein
MTSTLHPLPRPIAFPQGATNEGESGCLRSHMRPCAERRASGVSGLPRLSAVSESA